MTSMRRCYVASTSVRRHVPAGNLAPPWPPNILNLGPSNFLNLPTPMREAYGKRLETLVMVQKHGLVSRRLVVVVVVLFYVHGKHLRSCRDGQLT